MTRQLTPTVFPVDLEYDTIELAYEAAEIFTALDFEVTKPLDVDGKYCIRITE